MNLQLHNVTLSESQPRTCHLSLHIPLVTGQAVCKFYQQVRCLAGAFGCFGRVLE